MVEELIAFLNFNFELEKKNTKLVEGESVSIVSRWRVNWREYLQTLTSLGVDVNTENRAPLNRYNTLQSGPELYLDLVNFQSELRQTLVEVAQTQNLPLTFLNRVFRQTNGLPVYIDPIALNSDLNHHNIDPDNIDSLKIAHSYESSTYGLFIMAILRDLILQKRIFHLSFSEGLFVLDQTKNVLTGSEQPQLNAEESLETERLDLNEATTKAPIPLDLPQPEGAQTSNRLESNHQNELGIEKPALTSPLTSLGRMDSETISEAKGAELNPDQLDSVQITALELSSPLIKPLAQADRQNSQDSQDSGQDRQDRIVSAVYSPKAEIFQNPTTIKLEPWQNFPPTPQSQSSLKSEDDQTNQRDVVALGAHRAEPSDPTALPEAATRPSKGSFFSNLLRKAKSSIWKVLGSSKPPTDPEPVFPSSPTIALTTIGEPQFPVSPPTTAGEDEKYFVLTDDLIILEPIHDKQPQEAGNFSSVSAEETALSPPNPLCGQFASPEPLENDSLNAPDSASARLVTPITLGTANGETWNATETPDQVTNATESALENAAFEEPISEPKASSPLLSQFDPLALEPVYQIQMNVDDILDKTSLTTRPESTALETGEEAINEEAPDEEVLERLSLNDENSRPETTKVAAEQIQLDVDANLSEANLEAFPEETPESRLVLDEFDDANSSQANLSQMDEDADLNEASYLENFPAETVESPLALNEFSDAPSSELTWHNAGDNDPSISEPIDAINDANSGQANLSQLETDADLNAASLAEDSLAENSLAENSLAEDLVADLVEDWGAASSEAYLAETSESPLALHIFKGASSSELSLNNAGDNAPSISAPIDAFHDAKPSQANPSQAHLSQLDMGAALNAASWEENSLAAYPAETPESPLALNEFDDASSSEPSFNHPWDNAPSISAPIDAFNDANPSQAHLSPTNQIQREADAALDVPKLLNPVIIKARPIKTPDLANLTHIINQVNLIESRHPEPTLFDNLHAVDPGKCLAAWTELVKALKASQLTAIEIKESQIQEEAFHADYAHQSEPETRPFFELTADDIIDFTIPSASDMAIASSPVQTQDHDSLNKLEPTSFVLAPEGELELTESMETWLDNITDLENDALTEPPQPIIARPLFPASEEPLILREKVEPPSITIVPAAPLTTNAPPTANLPLVPTSTLSFVQAPSTQTATASADGIETNYETNINVDLTDDNLEPTPEEALEEFVANLPENLDYLPEGALPTELILVTMEQRWNIKSSLATRAVHY
jgi:hypothetical protein